MLNQHEQLIQKIHYDPETGIAVWNTPGSRRKATVGFVVQASRSKPYRYVKITSLVSRRPFSHLVHFYMTGRWPIKEMDHINGDTLDDRWENLRECTREQNEANRGPRRTNSTGFKGVYPVPGGKFRASYHRRGKRVYLGPFLTPDLAHAAYAAAVEKFDGEFLRVAV